MGGVISLGLEIYNTIDQHIVNEKVLSDLDKIIGQVGQNTYLLNENKNAINQNLAEIRHNGLDIRQNNDEIKKNGQAIDRNYVTIKQFEYSVNKNFEATFVHFHTIESKLNDALTSITNSKLAILDRIDLARAEIVQSVKDSRTEPIVSHLNTFFNYFINEAKAISAIEPQKRIAKLEEQNGILQYLKNSRTPLPGTMYTLLSDIINENFAIPTSKDDKMAIVMLELLCYGMHVYTLIIYFILQQYSILVENYYHNNEIDKYNKYYLLSMQNFNDFANTLTDSNNGFLDKVTKVLTTVKNLDFIQSNRKNVVQSVDKALSEFGAIKNVLDKIGKSFDSEVPSKLETKLDFSSSKIKTPIDKWKSGVSVSYAIQYLGKDTKLASMISEWSTEYTIDDLANPILKIPVDSSGRTRVIFRKFDNAKSQLVGIIKNATQTEFRDINRELYSATMQPNEKIGLKEIELYIENGADVNVALENDKRALHVAAENDNWTVASVLIQHGSNVDAQNDNGHTALHIAVEGGHESFVQNLLKSGANVNVKTDKAHLEMTPLHSAAYKGHSNIVQMLLHSDKVDVNAQSTTGFTPLHFAASFGKIDVVKLLIADNRTQIDTKSQQLLTSLHLASINNYDTIVHTLLNTNKVDVNAVAFNETSPLHLAALYGSKDVVSTLLDKGANFNAKTVNGSTVVHFAAANGNEDIVSSVSFENIVDMQDHHEITPLYMAYQYNNTKAAAKLVQKCANANIRLSGHKTLLHLAAINGDINAVHNLIEQKHSVATKNAWGKDPLYYAVQNGRVEIARILLQSNADPNSKDLENKPIFHLVTDLNEIDALNMVKMLLQNKANINITDKFNNTLLHVAIKKGYLSIIKFLLEKGADVNAKNIYNDTPFRLAKIIQPNRIDIAGFLAQKNAEDTGDKVDFLDACEKGNLNLIEYLHEVRAVDVQVKDSYNQNGLFKPIFGNGNLEVVKYLVNIGVSIREIDTDKYTLVNYAAYHNKFDIVKYLIEQGADFKSVNTYNSSLLHSAAENNNLEMVKYLLHLGLNANINDKGYESMTPLIFSIFNSGDLKLVKYLIKSGAQTNITDGNGKTALTWATKRNKLDIKQYLEQLPNDTKLQTQIDTNSLFFAAAQNNIKLVEQYLNKNISVNVKDEDDGQTPLYRAIYYNGQLDMIKFLISKGADFKQFDATKSDNLVYLSIIKHKFDVTKFLIENGADFQTAGISGNTPLHGAIEVESVDMLKYLLNKDAYNNHKNSAGKTPFDLLIEGRKDKLIKYLVFEYKDKQQQTMLHEAAFQGDNVNVQFLLERGAHVNAVDELKNTPLHLAAERGQLETVKLLIKQICVNISGKNIYGKSPLEVAQYNHMHNVADFLSSQMKPHAGGSQFFGEPATNSATKPSLLFSNIFNSFVGTLNSISETLTQIQMPTLFRDSIAPSNSNAMPSNKLTTPTQSIDLPSTLFLFDVLARKYTGQQYYNAQGQPVSACEARTYSLTLVQQYEKLLLSQLVSKQDSNVNQVESDMFSLYRTIERYMLSGQYSRIDSLLYLHANTTLSNLPNKSTVPQSQLIQMIDRLLIEAHNTQRDTNQIITTDSHSIISDIAAKAIQPKLIDTINTKQQQYLF